MVSLQAPGSSIMPGKVQGAGVRNAWGFSTTAGPRVVPYVCIYKNNGGTLENQLVISRVG